LKAEVQTSSVNKKSTISATKQFRLEATREMIKAKDSLVDIAQALNLSESTIIKYMEEMIEGDVIIDINYLLPSKKAQKEIWEGFKKNGNDKLRPVFEYCNGKYTYDEIRLCNLVN
jgi:hypothetical protein